MPRQARIDAPGVLQHIICRGIERGPIFVTADERLLASDERIPGDGDFVESILS